MVTHQHLYGSCACERNQYAISIPHSLIQNPSATAAASNLATVFFDNSRANRKSGPALSSSRPKTLEYIDKSLTSHPGRTQAAPLTAWLRIPLAWYHSNTRAFYPDESHASIRRTFYTPLTPSTSTSSRLENSSTSNTKQVRKQFCGYCGTHLNAWLEDDDDEGDKDRGGGSQWMDVTLGSLWGESLGVLEGLGWLNDDVSSNGDEEEEIATSGPRGILRQSAARSMSNRGLPFFEEMVDDSRLGKIKRRSGAHVGVDGRTVEWHVVELEGEDGGGDAVMGDGVISAETGNGNKRLKLGD